MNIFSVIWRFKNQAVQRFPGLARSVAYFRSRRRRFVALFMTVAHILGALTPVLAVRVARLLAPVQ